MSDIKNGDMPASPIEFCYDTDEGTTHEMFTGLSKREAFAMAAMQGMSSRPEFYGQSTDYPEVIAGSCILLADALLKELAK